MLAVADKAQEALASASVTYRRNSDMIFSARKSRIGCFDLARAARSAPVVVTVALSRQLGDDAVVRSVAPAPVVLGLAERLLSGR